MELVNGWYSITQNLDQVAAMGRELQRELAPSHSLFGSPVEAIARRNDRDDVLFRLLDGTGRVAVVHLTWRLSSPEVTGWPFTLMYPSLQAWTEGYLEATELTKVARVRVEIVAYVDATPPGWVECRLVDSHGRVWSFFENVTTVTEAAINAFTTYPQPGTIACQVVAQAGGVMTIDTASETGVQSVEGWTRFEVPESFLVAWS